MSRKAEYGKQIGAGPMRTFSVTLIDDPPERVEAVEFFGRVTRPMSQRSALPPEIDHMSYDEAQRYLDANPQKQRWSILHLFANADVDDSDLFRLEYLPELDRISLFGFGNDALRHLHHLQRLAGLVVYSDRVDDACLRHVSCLTNLESIDFQASPNMTPAAFLRITAELPRIVDVYPPRSDAKG